MFDNTAGGYGRRSIGFLQICALSFLAALSPSAALGAEHDDAGCLTCHNGIESIGKAHRGLTCDDCHGGDLDAATKEAAHKNMYTDPGDLNIVDETCGQCHENDVEVVKKSLHATSAGIISGARYTWAAQKQKNAVYAVRAVADSRKAIPGQLGAIASLKQIPHFKDSGQPIDDYLRNQCLRCHLWTAGKGRPGDYRGAGCTACHMIYADDGLSHSGDKAIAKDQPGHPIRHEITKKIPAEQCAHCHNRGGRTGVSYLGMMESDGYGTPFRPDGTKQPKLHGKNYNHLQEDLHLAAGLHCIDCHTVNDIHGDGNIYSKKEQAVEVECTDCHGTPEAYSTLKTSRQRLMKNLQRDNAEVFLTGKMDGKRHAVPQLRAFAERETLPVAMQIHKHIESLECYACHAPWAPQCYGCHAKMDMRTTGYDWVDEAKGGTYLWKESRSYLRWETPTLGVNSEGKVSPFIPGCQVIFTQIDKNGNPVVTNKVFTTADDHSGIAHNALNPHSISRRPRSCEDCHSSSKALGLGTGHYISRMNGVDIPFELERIVDEDGKQIQATSHVGARPFNREEMARVRRTNVCFGCHQESPGIFWETVKSKWGQVTSNPAHQNILREVLRASATGESRSENQP